MTIIPAFLSLLSLFGPVVSHEHYGTTLLPRSDDTTPGASFSYVGMTGPLNWYSLDRQANALCATGRNQSPTNLASDTNLSSSCSIVLDIPNAPEGALLENLGVAVDVFTNGTLTQRNVTSELVQFHFHTPSEHSVNGMHYPMEVHFVFQASDASVSVVGFFIDFGELDTLLEPIVAGLPDIPSHGNTTTTGPLDFSSILDHFCSNSIYQYSGSLTTPPCSEGVSWIISSEPIRIDVPSYDAFRQLLGFNARYIQNAIGEINLLENIARQLQGSD
ncbi:alpha carbonic anhydrase [Bombardia bombarda]|uniref:Carbonic anhydrase n=1 Tax=Bombardia bombarda TaxID=252184 RepID=A0AA39WCG0_9PEZI|nr:alpha carbonic anhydrase [Bombardia bombarda]